MKCPDESLEGGLLSYRSLVRQINGFGLYSALVFHFIVFMRSFLFCFSIVLMNEFAC